MPPSNQGWEVHAKPTHGGDIAIVLPIRACGDANAVCTADGRPLSQGVAALLPGTPFTAYFAQAPDEHDGSSAFKLHFYLSLEPQGLSYVAVRDSLFEVTGGSIEGARRLEPGKNRKWELTVAPDGFGDVTMSVKETTACDTPPGVCAADGRMLAGDLRTIVAGPASLSVADAEVHEGAGATLDFVVTLNKQRFATTTVDYATADGSAKAGVDYVAASGTLTFGPLVTSRTVSVAVLDDSEDEGSETMTLTLSNPSENVRIADGEATGTIENSDAMPKAWLARFGRTVAEQVIEAVESRFAPSRAPGVEVTLAGQRIEGTPGSGSGAGSGSGSGTSTPSAEDEAARAKLAALADWLQDEEREKDDPPRSRAVTRRELLTGSSFALTGQEGGGGKGIVGLWGLGAVSRFEGRAGDLTLDGEVASGMLGADWRRGPWTAGLLLSNSRGLGSYRGASAGKVESVLTGVYPYGRYAVNPRLAVWGVAGKGSGTLTLTPDGQKPIGTDMYLTMGALGLRGVALEAPAEGGVELALKSDALAVRTRSNAVRAGASGSSSNLAAATAAVTRLRLGLEGTWSGLTLGGGALAPRLEIGVRHDGGDAETGFGFDIGGGLAWSDAKRGITAEVRARGLLTHESRRFRDRGLSGALTWDPGASAGSPGQGPKLTVTQTLGTSSSGGADALLSRGALARLAGQRRRGARPAATTPGDRVGLRLLHLRRPLHLDAGDRHRAVRGGSRLPARLALDPRGEGRRVARVLTRSDPARERQRQWRPRSRARRRLPADGAVLGARSGLRDGDRPARIVMESGRQASGVIRRRWIEAVFEAAPGGPVRMRRGGRRGLRRIGAVFAEGPGGPVRMRRGGRRGLRRAKTCARIKRT